MHLPAERDRVKCKCDRTKRYGLLCRRCAWRERDRPPLVPKGGEVEWFRLLVRPDQAVDMDWFVRRYSM